MTREEWIKAERRIWVGFPQTEYLHMFGKLVLETFGEVPYVVGIALEKKGYRDVDVRLMMPSERYNAMFPACYDKRKTVLELAFSALGKQITGLDIDFQIQSMYTVTMRYKNFPRYGLGIHYQIPKTPLDFDAIDPESIGDFCRCDNPSIENGRCKNCYCDEITDENRDIATRPIKDLEL